MPRRKRAKYPSDNWDVRKNYGKAAATPPPPTEKKKRGRPRKGTSPAQSPSVAARSTAQTPTIKQLRKPSELGSFTRSRAAPPAKPLPTLAQLAQDEAPALAHVTGGICPSCNREHGDADKHCVHCGARLRRACAKCEKPLRDDQHFCPDCGESAPAPGQQLAPKRSDTALVPVGESAPASLGAEWEADDLFWVGAGVDMVAVRFDGDILDEKDRDRINGRAAAVANKHFRIGGKWKEEIKLGMAIAGALFPTMYGYFVMKPREEKRRRAELQQQQQAAQQPAPTQPNNLRSV